MHHAFVALTSRELGDKAKDFAKAILNYWPSGGEAPPVVTGDAVSAVKDASDDASLATALRAFVDTASPSLEPKRIWADTPLGVLLRGLFSVAKQYLRSTDAQEALSLCNDIRAAVDDPDRLAGHPNELAAAIMVVEDAVAAIEGYADAAPFAFVDEAYLAKYGLLQALQVGFDGAESVATFSASDYEPTVPKAVKPYLSPETSSLDTQSAGQWVASPGIIFTTAPRLMTRRSFG